MILHIIHDDKFPEKGIENFERILPNKNKSLIVTKLNDFIYLKNKPDFIINSKRWYMDKSFLKNIRSAEALVIHGMTNVGLVATMLARRNTRIIWIGWGYDYYNRIEKKCYTLVGSMTEQLRSIKKVVPKLTLFRRLKEYCNSLLYMYAIQRINYFSPVIPEDFDLFKQYFPKNKMVYMPWNYGITGSKSHVIPNTDLSLGPNILVGNSASYTNNHLEAFEILQHIDLGDRKIIVPLSYGDPNYRDYIVEVGKKLFGDAFIPLLDFMPIADYHEILQSCSIAIMNHYRQQAVGNISALIQSGVKVYLSERNPFLKTCKRIGVKVFLIEDLEKDYSSFYQPLTKLEKESNYLHYEKEFNQDNIQHQTQIIVDELLGSDS